MFDPNVFDYFYQLIGGFQTFDNFIGPIRIFHLRKYSSSLNFVADHIS